MDFCFKWKEGGFQLFIEKLKTNPEPWMSSWIKHFLTEICYFIWIPKPHDEKLYQEFSILQRQMKDQEDIFQKKLEDQERIINVLSDKINLLMAPRKDEKVNKKGPDWTRFGINKE